MDFAASLRRKISKNKLMTVPPIPTEHDLSFQKKCENRNNFLIIYFLTSQKKNPRTIIDDFLNFLFFIFPEILGIFLGILIFF
jgi:hypothetical protein